MVNTRLYWINEMLDEASMFCEKEGLAPSTTKARLHALEKVFRAVPSLEPVSIHGWLDGYTSTRTGRPLGPHGKNAYVIAVKWYLKRTALVPGAVSFLPCLARYETTCTGQHVSALEFERVVQFAPTSLHDLAYRLIYERGFRPHELLSIRAKDVRQEVETGRSNETNIDSETTRGIAWVFLPKENPAVPSRRNKTGARVVPVARQAARLLEASDVARQKGVTTRGCSRGSTSTCRPLFAG